MDDIKSISLEIFLERYLAQLDARRAYLREVRCRRKSQTESEFLNGEMSALGDVREYLRECLDRLRG